MGPKFSFILDNDFSLPVVAALSGLDAASLFYKAYDCRQPLGVYNVSVSRILKKTEKCSEKLSALYASGASHLSEEYKRAEEELVDYVELTLYAAAEHVDDVELIAQCFFPDRKSAKKDIRTQHFKRNAKPIRDRLSAFANALKHQQARVRLFRVRLTHDNISIPLLGFFIESVKNEVIGPSPIFHAKEAIVSMKSFLWDVVIYVIEMSMILKEFLESIVTIKEGAPVQNAQLEQCFKRLLELPIYSFDDEHPFTRVDVILDPAKFPKLDSPTALYGSAHKPWSESPKVIFSDLSQSYEGDGVTRSFKMTGPSQLQIRRLKVLASNSKS